MNKERILVVEDSQAISDILRLYFTAQGYEVMTAMRGGEALDICRKTPPHLALLDIGLPDMEGYDIGKALRASPRTRHIPIIFVTARGERHDKLKALGEVQAQYYVVKPFDLEEIRMVVTNELAAARRRNQSHPVTNLPTATFVTNQLRGLLGAEGWAMALVDLNGFDTFTQAYGTLVGEDVLKFAAVLLTETVYVLGDPDDFIGQMPVGQQFVIVSTPERMRTICEELIARFDQQIGLYYKYRDRRQGYVDVCDESGALRHAPLMSLSIGVLRSWDGPFYDIRELCDIAEETSQRASAYANEQGARSLICYGRVS